MIEEELVNRALTPYEKGDKSVLIGKIKDAMMQLLGVLRGIDKDSFQITKNAFIILHNILTAKTEDEVVGFAEQFNAPALLVASRNLYSLRLESEWCFRVIAIVQYIFFERGIGLADEYKDNAHKKVLLFRAKHGNEQTKEGIVLEQEEKEAFKIRQEVSKFFLKYSV